MYDEKSDSNEMNDDVDEMELEDKIVPNDFQEELVRDNMGNDIENNEDFAKRIRLLTSKIYESKKKNKLTPVILFHFILNFLY